MSRTPRMTKNRPTVLAPEGLCSLTKATLADLVWSFAKVDYFTDPMAGELATLRRIRAALPGVHPPKEDVSKLHTMIHNRAKGADDGA